MNDREFYDLVKRFNRFSYNETMTLDQYRAMMGILGDTFMAERMFKAMDTDKNGTITLEEYLNFNNVISNGSIKEKRQQNFSMFQEDLKPQVTYLEFENFVIQTLDMYSRSVSEKINTNLEMIREIFDKIAKDTNDYFTFDDFEEALDKTPNLLVWLEKPKEMFNDMIEDIDGRQFILVI